MDPATASEIRSLMKETVLHGTSRGSFRGFFRKDFMDFDVGGKTGSLTGFDPKGKYDWFVGYAHSSGRKIAVAALTIHEKQWRVKSSYLARRAIESYFKESVHHPKTIVKR
jgi:cell division protein FtsI/penicillin-binding protein 2